MNNDQLGPVPGPPDYARSPQELAAMIRQGIAHPQMSTAQLSEAWCVLSRVSPTQEPVKRLLATIAKQEQELAEARKRITDLERCDEILHQDGERWRKIASDKHHEAEKAREQRDRLAEALRIIMEDQKTDPFIFELAQKALAAVEGGRSE